MTKFTTEKRDQLYILRREGCTQQEIAKRLTINQSSISRELTRNRAGPRLGYLPDRADMIAKQRRKKAKSDCEHWYDYAPLLEYVLNKLTGRSHYSPEQISGRLRKDFPKDERMRVSFESIYQYIWTDKQNGGTLHINLRNRGKRHKKRGKQDARGMIPNRKDISTRPKEAEDKRTVGHYESDLIIGLQTNSNTIMTIVERKTKKIFGGMIRRSADAFAKRTTKIFSKLPAELRKTMTHDNGKEIANHEQITKAIGMDVYCARAYHSWERGLNELSNRFIRQYFSKGTNFDNITDAEVNEVIEAINNRPRKVLNYRTPNEAFTEEQMKLCISD